MEKPTLSENDTTALIERLRRLHRFWKRLAVVALLLLVVGIGIGGWLIVRAYSQAEVERQRAEAADERALVRQLLLQSIDSFSRPADLETMTKFMEEFKSYRELTPAEKRLKAAREEKK